MKWYAAAALLACCALGEAGFSRRVGRIWISGASIVSPDNLEQVADGNVLIEHGKIVRVDHNPHERPPTGATVISAKGQFLVPGLIDSHVHLAAVPGMRPGQEPEPRQPKPKMIHEYFEQLPRSYLYFGYTTVIDLAVGDPSVLDDFRHAPLHPDLYDCGPSLPTANGYPMSEFSAETRFRLFPNWLLDPEHMSHLPEGYDPTKHTPGSAVARVKNDGGICVKTYFDRGYGPNRNLPVIGAGLMAEVRDAAHHDGLVAVMHANSFEAQQFAVNAGVDVIAHGLWNWGDLDQQPALPPEITLLLDRIVQNRIGYQSTMQVMEGFRANFDPDYLEMKAVAKVVPAKLLAWYRSADGHWFKQEILAGSSASDAVVRGRFEQGVLRRGNQVVSYLAARNARFLFGTDTPSAPTYGNLPGLNGYLEMQDLHRAGLSSRQILRAATSENALMFHLDSQVGTIEPGKIANLLLLQKSPLDTVDAYDSITTVFIHGTPIPRTALAASRN